MAGGNANANRPGFFGMSAEDWKKVAKTTTFKVGDFSIALYGGSDFQLKKELDERWREKTSSSQKIEKFSELIIFAKL